MSGTGRPTRPQRTGWLALAGLVLAGIPGAARAAEVSPEVLQAEQQRIAAINKAAPTAIAVFASGGQGGGSGVVITPDGYALSNFHVTKPAGDYMQCSMADGRLYDAVIVGIDPTGDVALIKLLGRDDFPHATLADSDQVRVGDWCFAIGNPFLLATDFQPTVTCGIISGVHRYQFPSGTLLEYADCLQTDASINPGNSGGPLFNAQGDLIGINGRCSFEKRGRVNVGVGYAISINQIKNFLGYLHSGRIVDHATLGATVSSDEDGRVIVTNILETCDAYRRGLRYGDEIMAFGGRPVSTVNGFKNILGIFPRDWRIPLSYRREGQRYDVYVRLMGLHAKEELITKTEGPSLPVPEPKPQPKPPRGDDPEGPGPEEPPPGQPVPLKPAPGQPAPKQIPLPKRIPLPGHPQMQKPVPEHVKKLIEKRTGYANYYFNQLNRDRVWNSFLTQTGQADPPAVWTLRGTIEGRGAVEVVLGAEQVSGKFGQDQFQLDLKQDLAEQLAPEGSGGLLVALHLWHRLLQTGPAKFGDVYYLGTVPVLDRQGLCDALVATYNVVEARFLFDPAGGRLIGLEMFPDPDVDPCEVSLDDYREVNGRWWPHLLKVRHGDQIFGEIRLQEITGSTSAAN